MADLKIPIPVYIKFFECFTIRDDEFCLKHTILSGKEYMIINRRIFDDSEYITFIDQLGWQFTISFLTKYPSGVFKKEPYFEIITYP